MELPHILLDVIAFVSAKHIRHKRTREHNKLESQAYSMDGGGGAGGCDLDFNDMVAKSSASARSATCKTDTADQAECPNMEMRP